MYVAIFVMATRRILQIFFPVVASFLSQQLPRLFPILKPFHSFLTLTSVFCDTSYANGKVLNLLFFWTVLKNGPPNISIYSTLYLQIYIQERYACCYSFIVSPNKPISYKLLPYLLCYVQLPRKTAGKQSVNSKQPISKEQCTIPRRVRAGRGRAGERRQREKLF